MLNKQKKIQVLEFLFYQYFIEGCDNGDLATLIQLSKQINIYNKIIRNYLLAYLDNASLLRRHEQGKKICIKVIPCFIFNKELVVSGVESKENFIQIINSLNINV